MRKMQIIFPAMLFLSILIGITSAQNVTPRGILPVLESDYAVQPVAFPYVRLTDNFWAPRQEINRKHSIPYAFEKCETTGRLSNFLLAANTAPAGTKYVEPIFNDTDIYKGIEAASFDLAQNPNPETEAYLDRLIEIVGQAQESDGYLYTAHSRSRDFSQKNPTSEALRWRGLAWSHELYCAGHMFEAATAHYTATGKRNFLDIACRTADLLVKTFGTQLGQYCDVPGHEVVEMGLVKLYRCTGKREYLDLAKFFVEMRGREDLRASRADNPKAMYGKYSQDACPLVEETEAVGHAVRAVYLYEGAADVAAITKDTKLVEAIERIWKNAVGKKIYLTGGLGGTPDGEAFADNYVLSNHNGYSETCAQIGGCGWHQRMFLFNPDAKYYDVLEQTLYNSLISGISLSGDKFFYPNQLASRGGIERAEWFGCACCPQNLMRFISSLGGYVYATENDRLFVALYIANQATVPLNGQNVKLEMTGNYPWTEDVKIAVTPEKSGEEFTLALRVPGWLSDSPFAEGLYRYTDGKTFFPTVKVNGETVSVTETERGFLNIRRAWQAGDVVEIHFPLEPRWVECDPQVKANCDRLALMRGPIVYTFEGCDNENHIFDVFVSQNSKVTASAYRPDFLGGVVTLATEGTLMAGGGNISLTAIPYCVWANRERVPMQVWMASEAYRDSQVKALGLAAKAKFSSSFCRTPTSSMSPKAVNDGFYPGNEEDYSGNFDFWPRQGTEDPNTPAEWVQYDFEEAETISKVRVYWFNDLKRGGNCADPESWRILVQLPNGTWTEPSQLQPGYSTDSADWCEVTFAPVAVRAIKLEIRLRPKFSAGIYEWMVE
ncbi:MAG: glycoside hydrolase family 127 protein [Planctomycetia bacterium]|nr:glycoside hydrolase family 127 protein [Planctomycetia bacterium]